MKRIVTEIYVEIEETVEMRSGGTKKIEQRDAPLTIEQTICPHCGKTINRIENQNTGEK